MPALLANVTSAVLMLIGFGVASRTLRPLTLRCRPTPWVALALTMLAVAGIVAQSMWPPVMDALENAPGRTGWWRVITSVFLQNGGAIGDAWNILTLAVVAALAEWFWGPVLTLVLFGAGAVMPGALSVLMAGSRLGTDPRNVVGSSGATYFLVATIAGAALIAAPTIASKSLAAVVPVLGLATWFVLGNAHGLVAAEGFVVGVIAWLSFGRHRLRRLRRVSSATEHVNTREAS